MSDISHKPPRVRARVESAVTAKHNAVGLRQTADKYAGMDPTGARFMRKDADAIEAKADSELSRWSYTTGPVQVGNGGELVPLPEPGTSHIAEHVAEPTDMLAHSASTQRMELATGTDSSALGLDAANAIKARDSVERMLMEQAAAAHKLAMQFLAKAAISYRRWIPGTQRRGPLIASKQRGSHTPPVSSWAPSTMQC